MTRVRRRPGKIELFLDWIECIFWLIPMSIVVLGAALGAVAFYLSSCLLTTGCARMAGAGRHNHPKFAWKRTKPIRPGLIPKTAAEARKSHIFLAHWNSEPPACKIPITLKRAAKGGFFRVGLSGCVPRRPCRSVRTPAVGRFSGTAGMNRPGFDRF